MAQIFHPAMNTVAKATLFGLVFLIGGGLWVASLIQRSPYVTGTEVARIQPVPFSHEHHVRGLGIDCRYCHGSAETSSFAGIPPTKTCMTCHSKIWTNAALLEPVRESWRTGVPLQWTRVHRLPDYVFFNHSIHVNKGIGCVSCHGQVDRMPLMWSVASLQMEWCLNCHRNPEQYLRPVEEVYNLNWQPPGDQLELGRKLVQDYHIPVERLSDCYTCHR